MWLPLRLVLEFLGRSLVWLAVMGAFGAAAALLLAAVHRPLRGAWRRLILAGVAGAVLGASLAARFDLPEALAFEVWRRSVPLAWSAGGALLGALAAAAVTHLSRARTASSPAAASAPEPPAD